MRYLIAITLLLASAVDASSDPMAEIRSCKIEADAQKRLACFDAIEVEIPNEDNLAKKAAAISLAKVVLRLQEEDPRKRIYNSRVELIPTFKNDTKKTVVAIEHTISITDAFGDKIVDGRSKLDIKIPPGKTVESEMIYWWDNNPFIQNEPFDKLQGPVGTGVAKASLIVTKAVFSDGSTESYE